MSRPLAARLAALLLACAVGWIAEGCDINRTIREEARERLAEQVALDSTRAALRARVLRSFTDAGDTAAVRAFGLDGVSP